MSLFLVDTNVVSILFKPQHSKYGICSELLTGAQLFLSFMTRAELLLWPRRNHWGRHRVEGLAKHIDLFTTLFPDEATCAAWADVVLESQRSGYTIADADAWIAATARQWDLPLVTTDHRDFQHLSELTIVPVI